MSIKIQQGRPHCGSFCARSLSARPVCSVEPARKGTWPGIGQETIGFCYHDGIALAAKCFELSPVEYLDVPPVIFNHSELL